MAKLGDVCSYITDGSHNPPQGLGNSDYYMLSSKNIDDDRITLESPRYLSPVDFESENKRTQIASGDLLMTIVGTIGRVAIVSEDMPPFCVQRSVAVIKSRNDIIFNRFLMYQLQSMRSYLEKESRGVAQKGIYLKQLTNLSIMVPAMTEQKYIANVLDRVSYLITMRKQQFDKLDELVKARFVEMFGDLVTNQHGFMVAPLQQLIDEGLITYHLDGNHGGDYPRSEEFTPEGVPYIGANCIADGRIDFTLAKHLPLERANKLRKGIAQNGDVLFAHNATVGPVVMLTTNEPKVILSTSLTAYRCDHSQINPYYLRSYMESDSFVNQYSSEMKQTTRNQVPITAQKKYLFMVPPIELQEQFASFVEQTDKSKLTIQQGLDKLETMKKALMQQYFGGGKQNGYDAL